MENAMLEARHEAGAYRRIEVITGGKRRKNWTTAEKTRIVAESRKPGANVSEVARRNGVSRGILTVWRRQARELAEQEKRFVKRGGGRRNLTLFHSRRLLWSDERKRSQAFVQGAKLCRSRFYYPKKRSSNAEKPRSAPCRCFSLDLLSRRASVHRDHCPRERLSTL